MFLTNHRGFAASTIAAIYRQRWQIELFFKALKQNLRIKTFVGTSPNALQIQIWTALIALLVLKYLQLRARFGWSLSNLAALLRQQLFVYRDLIAWIDRTVPASAAARPWRRATGAFLVSRTWTAEMPTSTCKSTTEAPKCPGFLQLSRLILANLDSSGCAFLIRMDLSLFQNACFQPASDQVDQTRVSHPMFDKTEHPFVA